MYQICKDDLENLMRRMIAAMRKDNKRGCSRGKRIEGVIDEKVKCEICRVRLKSLSQGRQESIGMNED